MGAGLDGPKLINFLFGGVAASFSSALRHLFGAFDLSWEWLALADLARNRCGGVSTTVSWVSALRGLALDFWKFAFPVESWSFGHGFWASSTWLS